MFFLPYGDNVDRPSPPIVPSILLFVTVAVFVRQLVIEFESHADPKASLDFIQSWGLTPSDLAKGKVLGLFTYMFLHDGIFHILFNMLAFWAFACSLEIGLGGFYLACFYIAWGVGAGLLHCAMNWGSDIPMIGASGAIAGLIGAYTVLYGADSKIKTLFFFFFRAIKIEIPAMVFGVGWFGLQLWSAHNDPQGLAGFAWYAHIGGFSLGALTVWLIKNDLDHQLVRDSQGELTFQRNPSVDDDTAPEAAAEPEPALAEGDLPGECPYCHTAIDESNHIATGLARCPNPACQRMIYAGAEMVPY